MKLPGIKPSDVFLIIALMFIVFIMLAFVSPAWNQLLAMSSNLP